MVRSHLSTDSGTKVAYQILQGAKVPTTALVGSLLAFLNVSPEYQSGV